MVTHEEKGIVISESHKNCIYNNLVSDSSRAIDLDKESFGNTIHHNVIENIPDPSEALNTEEGAAVNNTLYSNKHKYNMCLLIALIELIYASNA